MKAKSDKQTEANARNAAWAKFTPAQQLEYLNKNGLVATKQRKKIEKKMVP